MSLLYEKIRVQQVALGQGEKQYQERLDDANTLKLEIKRLRREHTSLVKEADIVQELKTEVAHMQRDLMKERQRCRALEEEIETPMNVHRWRKLEGSDPDTFELVQKVQALQKRLIAKVCSRSSSENSGDLDLFS